MAKLGAWLNAKSEIYAPKSAMLFVSENVGALANPFLAWLSHALDFIL